MIYASCKKQIFVLTVEGTVVRVVSFKENIKSVFATQKTEELLLNQKAKTQLQIPKFSKFKESSSDDLVFIPKSAKTPKAPSLQLSPTNIINFLEVSRKDLGGELTEDLRIELQFEKECFREKKLKKI